MVKAGGETAPLRENTAPFHLNFLIKMNKSWEHHIQNAFFRQQFCEWHVIKKETLLEYPVQATDSRCFSKKFVNLAAPLSYVIVSIKLHF